MLTAEICSERLSGIEARLQELQCEIAGQVEKCEAAASLANVRMRNRTAVFEVAAARLEGRLAAVERQAARLDPTDLDQRVEHRVMQVLTQALCVRSTSGASASARTSAPERS